VEPDRRIAGWSGRCGGPDRFGQPCFHQRCAFDLRSGAHWHDLPESYGKYKSVHKLLSRWSASGVWEKVFRGLVADRKNANLMIDSTIVGAHQQAATGRKKRGRGHTKTALRGRYACCVPCWVSRSAATTAWPSRTESKRAAARRQLVDPIQRMHTDISGTYVSRASLRFCAAPAILWPQAR
jgi:transposase